MFEIFRKAIIVAALLQAISASVVNSQLTNKMAIKQETNRIDWRIPLTNVLTDGVKPGVLVQVEIDLSKALESDRSLNQENISFCLSDALGSQCVNSRNVDIYQQNFRSGLLFISKILGEDVKDQFVTVIISDRIMEAEAHKLFYEVNWDAWDQKPSESELLCPFDCSGKGTCQQGLCHCSDDYIGRACEFKIKSMDKSQSVWRAQMVENDILWLKIDSESQLLLIDFIQGQIQFVAFADSFSYQISSQYLLNKPQKVILDKRYILENKETSSNKDTSPFLKAEEEKFDNQQPLLMCFFAYAKQTQFNLLTSERKIREIAVELDKDYTISDPRSELLTFVICGLVFLIFFGCIVLFFVCIQYSDEKKKAAILQLYISVPFKSLQPSLQNEDTCRICLEKYTPDTIVRVHHICKKVFHKQCFDKWAQTGKNKKCPQCRDDYEPIVVEMLKKQLQETNQDNQIEMERHANEQPQEYANPPNGDYSLSSNLIHEPFVNQSTESHSQGDSTRPSSSSSAYTSPNPMIIQLAGVAAPTSEKKNKRKRNQKKKNPQDYISFKSEEQSDTSESFANHRKESDSSDTPARENRLSQDLSSDQQDDKQTDPQSTHGQLIVEDKESLI